MTTDRTAADAFGAALRTGAAVLEESDGTRTPLPVQRWVAPPDPADESLLARATGPTLDVGCGPGRFTAALCARGRTVLGVDLSAEAVEMTLARGGPALRRNVFDRIPGAGRWHTVLLTDGNVGIGGDPVRLLRRSRELLHPEVASARVLVEIEAPDPAGWPAGSRPVRIHAAGIVSEWFPWSRVGADAVAAVATAAGLLVTSLWVTGTRCHAELTPDRSRSSLAA